MKAFVLMNCLMVSRYPDSCVIFVVRVYQVHDTCKIFEWRLTTGETEKGQFSVNSSFVYCSPFFMIDFFISYMQLNVRFDIFFSENSTTLLHVFLCIFGIVQLYRESIITKGRGFEIFRWTFDQLYYDLEIVVRQLSSFGNDLCAILQRACSMFQIMLIV
jgi:hypothetical protein